MTNRRIDFLSVDEKGRIILPPDLAARLNFSPGQVIPYREVAGELHLLRPVGELARVYIEPTSACNFDCLTCMRNAWNEPLGQMSRKVFDQVCAGLEVISPRPLVFFGGYGEPLSHPDILQMIRQVKQLDARVELITNGSLLDGTMVRGLIESGLDCLWVSVDGASAESYADVRLGEALPLVIQNLEELRRMQVETGSETPHLGLAFVAMRRNIQELPEVIRLGRRLGANRFSITNVLAHTPELGEESLYTRSYYEADGRISPSSPEIDLPRMEINDLTAQPLIDALRGRATIRIAGQALELGGNRCPFVEKRSLSIRWDGEVSPCLPLLHGHTHYLASKRRVIKPVSFGNVSSQPLAEIWNQAAFQGLRESLLGFDFSPCVFCNSCEFSESNQEDCFGNVAPTCGGCLWAQGFIRCP